MWFTGVAERRAERAFAILVAVGWLLLGVAIWTSAKDEPDPVLPA